MAFALLSRPKRAATVSRMPMHKRESVTGRRATNSQPGFERPGSLLGATSLPMAPVVQTKLKIGEPNDKFEQEADRVAEQVMRMPELQALEGAAISGSASPARIQRVCRECEEEFSSRPVAMQRMCPECEEELHRQPMEKKEEKEAIQAKETSGRTPEITSAVQAQIDGLRGHGQPLPKSMRAFFEPRFGYDFSGVRVHTDGRTAQLARAVNARAFTVGRNVVFGVGQYAPMTTSGRTLLAHELAHVAQQADGVQGVIRRQANHTFEDCNDTQKKQIEAAAKIAAKAVGRAEAFVGSAYGRPDKMSGKTRALLQTHFHTTKRDHLRGILSKFIDIGEAFDKGVDFQCEKICKPIRGTIPCGYAYSTQLFGGLGDVHLCFDTRARGCHFMTSLSAQDREVLLIHEVAHRHAGVDDKAYIFEKKYKKLSPDEAMDNADSYAWFAVQV